MDIFEINEWFEPEWDWDWEDIEMKNHWQAGDATGGAPHKHVAHFRHDNTSVEVTVTPVRVGNVIQYTDGQRFWRKNEVRKVITGPEPKKASGKKKAELRGTGTGKVGYQYWKVGYWAGGIIK